MKIIIPLVFILSTVVHAHAQMDEDRLFHLQKVEKYRRMKSTGAVLTVTGGILFIAGIVTLSNVEYITTTNGSGYTQTTATSGNPGAGIAGFLIGGLGVGAGVPLWIVGSHAHTKWKRKLDGVAVGIKVNHHGAGLTLRF